MKKLEKLHYIGRSTYSTNKKFINESKKYGIQRSFPINIIRHQIKQFGKEIYLGQWKFTHQPDGETTRLGNATVFGKMQITGLTLPAETGKKIFGKIKNVKLQEPKCVNRECGKYIVVVIIFTTKTLIEILDLIEEKIGKTKIFLTGNFIELNPNILLENMAFSRTLVNVFMNPTNTTEITEKEITFIKDYQQTKYHPKGV